MRIAVPNKGRLHNPTLDLLERAGLHLVDLLDLGYGTCRIVLAAPEDGEIGSVADLDGGAVATEFPNITREFFTDREVNVDVVEVSGATELTPHVDIADSIVDITSTGTTLRMNRLAEVEELLESSVRLFARTGTAEDSKVRQVATALGSVLAAEDRRYLMMNVPEDCLEDVRDVMPGMSGPTVMDIAGTEWVAVHAVVEEREVFETISALKQVGASDILVTEIERLIE